jgi:hypothetical protein
MTKHEFTTPTKGEPTMARETRRGRRSSTTINKGRITLREELAAAKAAIRFAIWDSASDVAEFCGEEQRRKKLGSKAMSDRVYKGAERSGDLSLHLYEEALDAVFGRKRPKAADRLVRV